MSNVTLDELMQGLENTSGLEKEAGEVEAKEAAVEAESSVAAELEAILTKEAGEAKVAAAEETPKTPTEESVEMNKEAQEAGVQLAGAIISALTKQANEIKDKSESLSSDQDSETERTPTGTVNQVLKAIQDRGASNGATDTKTNEEGADANDEGKASASVGEQPAANSDIEKAAAVSHLCGEGHSFEDAVALVKEAEEAILAEEVEQVKVAAVNELLGQGIGIEDAVALVSAELNGNA